MFVSVLMLTYNHEAYVAKAIESVLQQRGNYELIIGDDASTDNTPAIIKKYQRQYPNIIVPVLREKNIGATRNFIDIYNRARAIYVAHLEGDDFWTDRNKLIKQAEFLERNPEFVISFTDYVELDENSGLYTTKNNMLEKEVFDTKDIIEKNFIPTLTCVYSKVIRKLPEDIADIKTSDWALHILNSLHGKIKYHRNWITGVYRIHKNAMWSQLNELDKIYSRIQLYEFLAKNLDRKFYPQIKKKLITNYYKLASLYIKNNNIQEAKRIKNKLEEKKLIFNSEYIKLLIKLNHK